MKKQKIVEFERDCLDVFREITEIMGGCQRCGECCRNQDVIISPRDKKRICKYLGIAIPEFEKEYLKPDKRHIPWPCPFLDKDNNCKIYSVRPKPCEAHPFTITFPKIMLINIGLCPLSTKIFEEFCQFCDRTDKRIGHKKEIEEFIKNGHRWTPDDDREYPINLQIPPKYLVEFLEELKNDG